MTKEEKQKEVARLKDVFSSSNGIYLTDFTGLNVELFTRLRRKLRDHSISYRVVKNTLATRAAKQAGLDELAELLEGPTAIACTDADPLLPAKVISEFMKAEERPQFKSASIENHTYTAEQIASLAALPSKNELLSMVVWGIGSPLSSLVATLQGTLQALVATLDAIVAQTQQETPAE